MLGDDPVFSLSTGSCGTSSTGSRWLRAVGPRATTRPTCTIASTTSCVHYSRGNTELNYRRFFAVTTLAGVRVEDPEVFAATHALVRGGRPPGSPVCASTTRTGWSTRRSIWTGCGRSLRTSGSPWRRSWRRANSCRGLAGLRHHRLRRDARGQRPLHRSGCRIHLHRALPAADRRSKSIAEHIEVGKRMVVTDAAAGGDPADGRPGARSDRRRSGAGRGRRGLRGLPLLPAGRGGASRSRAGGGRDPPAGVGRGPTGSAPGCTIMPTSWPDGCSSSAARPWPRASRTRRTTATPGSSP